MTDSAAELRSESRAETNTAPDPALAPSAQRLPVWLLPSLLLAGLTASAFGQQVIFDNRVRFYKDEPGFPPHPIEYVREQMWNMFYNHAIGFGTFGAMLVGLIGLFIGLTINPKRGMLGLFVGIAIGALVGIVVGPIGYLISNSLIPSLMEGTLKSMLVYSPLWLTFGVVASVFAALLLRRGRLVGNAVIMGLIAGCIAAIAFPILCSLIQPSSRFELIIPEEFGGRFLGYATGAVCTSLAAFRIAQLSAGSAPTTTISSPG